MSTTTRNTFFNHEFLLFELLSFENLFVFIESEDLLGWGVGDYRPFRGEASEVNKDCSLVKVLIFPVKERVIVFRIILFQWESLNALIFYVRVIFRKFFWHNLQHAFLLHDAPLTAFLGDKVILFKFFCLELIDFLGFELYLSVLHATEIQTHSVVIRVYHYDIEVTSLN